MAEKEYIEREAAVCVCANQYKECLRKSDWCGDTVAWNIGFAIKAIPTADVAPVRHGRWIKTIRENGCAEWTDFTCSVCGSVFDGNDWLFSEWKGCPVCLAKMDLGGG